MFLLPGTHSICHVAEPSSPLPDSLTMPCCPGARDWKCGCALRGWREWMDPLDSRHSSAAKGSGDRGLDQQHACALGGRDYNADRDACPKRSARRQAQFVLTIVGCAAARADQQRSQICPMTTDTEGGLDARLGCVDAVWAKLPRQ